MYELVRLIQFELFCVAVDCFYYGFVCGYDHIEWREKGWLIVSPSA